jgi:hypothetical protein
MVWIEFDHTTKLVNGTVVIEEFQKGEILSGTPPEQSAEHAASLRKAAASGRASDFWHGYLKLALEGHWATGGMVRPHRYR